MNKSESDTGLKACVDPLNSMEYKIPKEEILKGIFNQRIEVLNQILAKIF